MNRNGEELLQIYSEVPVLVDLIKLGEDSRTTSAMKDQIMILEQGLQFLVIYIDLLLLLNPIILPPKEKKYLNFGQITLISETLEKEGLLETGVRALESGDFKDWDTVSAELLEEIQSYKPYIWEDCFFFSDGIYSGRWFTVNFLVKFMRYVDLSMDNVVLINGDNIMMMNNPDEKMKFEFVKEKLDMFRIVFEFLKEEFIGLCCDFECALNAWVCNAAYLCLFYWVIEENRASSEGKVMLSKLYRNFEFPHQEVIKYCLDYLYHYKIPVEERFKMGEVVSPDVTKMCLSYLIATNLSADNRSEVSAVVFRFTESLCWNLKVYLANQYTEVILDGIRFFLTFTMDPPSFEAKEGNLVLIQAQEALKQVVTVIISLPSGEMDEAGIVDLANFLLHDFCQMVITIKEEVRKTYSHLFLNPSFNFPRLNILHLFDSSIEYVKEIVSNFKYHPLLTLEKELVILIDLLKASNLKDSVVLELQNEHMEFKDLWTQISNVAHKAERIIRSYAYQDSLWVGILSLLDVREEIRQLLPKIKSIKEKQVKYPYTCRNQINSNPVVPLKSHVQEMDEIVVGFEGKAMEIRNWLTHGSKKLNIISIIGMAGLGKTTLAKKVYNDPLVRHHFTICAWCTVSQSYECKTLLIDILKDVTEVNDSFTEMEEEDLADKLRKCLKGIRYLIVFDDIWDVGAWNVVKLSFPDDEQHSRILFTSRIHNIVLNSFQYLLSQLSDQESWELLERRLFNNKDVCPRNFVHHGKQIAIDCKGLPLAVVLVAGLLKKEIDNLDWWKQIGESLDSRISKGGCANVLELSYKHLSEPLKVCFLYLGLFKEDEVIQVHKLVNLWVSEGFIQKKSTNDVEILAREYVMDLIGRSLLIIADRSSNGGIKTCRIHDLLREFCLDKSKEEHFLKLFHGRYVSHSTMDEHYRVSIQTQHWKHFFARKSSPIYSLRICPRDTYYNAINIRPNSFCNAIFLHVLDLEEAEYDGDFPEEITTLIFLRYLAIWCTTRFIPVTIGKLGKLQTLRIISKETFLLPSEIFRMETLRHVHIGKFFPHVLFSSILPMKSIHSFSTPYLTYGKEAETFLSKLQTIQKLKCQFGSFKKNQMVKLDFLNQLKSLNLTHDGHPRLSSFVFSLPIYIKKLTMSNFGLPWSEISRIADLPNLEVLKLLVDSFVGKFWNMGAEEFTRLKFLKLQGLNVQKWSASHENFPSLEQIVVEQCHKLEEIPIEFVEISTLVKIQIRRCRSSVVKSVKEIKDEQIELGTLNFKMEAVQILSEKLFG